MTPRGGCAGLCLRLDELPVGSARQAANSTSLRHRPFTIARSHLLDGQGALDAPRLV